MKLIGLLDFDFLTTVTLPKGNIVVTSFTVQMTVLVVGTVGTATVRESNTVVGMVLLLFRLHRITW